MYDPYLCNANGENVMNNLVYKKWSQDVGVRAIDEAFGDVKHPGEDALSGGDYSYKEEIGFLYSWYFSCWQELPFPLLERNASCLTYLSVEGLQYVLPAYLTWYRIGWKTCEWLKAALSPMSEMDEDLWIKSIYDSNDILLDSHEFGHRLLHELCRGRIPMNDKQKATLDRFFLCHEETLEDEEKELVKAVREVYGIHSTGGAAGDWVPTVTDSVKLRQEALEYYSETLALYKHTCFRYSEIEQQVIKRLTT